MAQFNLNDYETVAERIQRFYKDHPDGRIVTEDLTKWRDRERNTWRVIARIYKTHDQSEYMPSASGHAFEVDGVNGIANKTSALENAETSAVGRALAMLGYSVSKTQLASREEMEKVQRAQTPAAPKRDWTAQVEALTDVETARQLYNEARTQKAGNLVLEAIKGKVATLGPASS